MRQEVARRWRFRIPFLLTATVLTTPPLATARDAAPANRQQLVERKEDLADLRQRIDRLKHDLSSGESARTEAADRLREHETAISELQRQLFELAQSREEQESRRKTLAEQAAFAEKTLGQQQGRLHQLLIRQYMSGTPGPLQLLLSGQSPSQTARDMVYLGAIGEARQLLVRQTESLIDEKKRLADATQRQTEVIIAIEAQQKQKQAEMQGQRQQKLKALAAISSRLATQRREVETLRLDERRLAQLIDRLGKLLAQKPKPAKPVRRPPPETSGRPAVIDASPGPFAALRGRLIAPTTGAIVQGFGTAREGGVRGRGIFIRAATGGEVRAVADGQIVFADWLRGFGNLVVVDHDDGYLSVYGQNDALLRRVGDRVRAGDRIAAVGDSGGRGESGLYFELRRQGVAIDPGPWLRK